MADTFRIVTLNAVSGAVTNVKDLNDLTTYYTVRETLTIGAPERQVAYAANSRRYAGSRAVSEAHQNGSVAWSTMVKGTTSDTVLANAESVLSVLEDARLDLYLEWRPDGATNSTYYEIRGPGTWTPTYKWAQFLGARSMQVDFSIPVGPLARGSRTSITVGALTLPNVASVTIPGDAPALVDISMTHSGGGVAPAWAMVGWYRPTSVFTPTAGQYFSSGIASASTATNLITWTVQADALYRGGNGLKATAAGSFGATANFTFVGDAPADDWSPDAYVEVWARIQMASTLVSPKLTAWVLTNGSRIIYSAPYGSAGKLVTPPSSGTAFRMVHVGTIPLASTGATFRLQAAAGAGSTGTFGLDYLVTVPTAARTLGPTGKAHDATYPDFMLSTGTVTKVIYADLSTGLPTIVNPDVGMGGATVQMEPGVNTMVFKYSSLVPDDPTADATTEQLSHALTACSLGVWPRYFLARGT